MRLRVGLRRRVAAAAMIGAAVAAAFGVAAEQALGAAAPPPWLPAAIFTVMMMVVIATVERHHPFTRFGAANHVTMFRGVLLSAAASALVAPPSAALAWIVVLLSVAFALLDGVDGRLARRGAMTSAFGARFDMETDALFIFVLSMLTWQHGKAGVWIVSAGLMRYAFVAAGRLGPWLAAPLRPTRRGRAVAVAQFVGLAVALAPAVPRSWSAPVAAMTLAALTWSFAIDVRALWRRRAASAVAPPLS